MDEPGRATYERRFRKVLGHIEAHLDGDLSLDALAAVASSSRFHFHRQFSALFDVSVHEYVKRLRLRRAATELAFRAERSVLSIALACSYESPEAFARAFKQLFAQTPTEFRAEPRWAAFDEATQPVRDVRRLHMKPAPTIADVQFVDFPETKVAVLEHRGPPSLIGDSVRRFIQFRQQHQLKPPRSAMFNVWYDDPRTTPPADFRLDLCASTAVDVAANDFGVVMKSIPAGRCAVLRHVGSEDGLEASTRFLYAEWLPASGHELRDFPLFFQRVRFFPDVPESEAVLDIFLTVR